jgi:hypothetical protein
MAHRKQLLTNASIICEFGRTPYMDEDLDPLAVCRGARECFDATRRHPQARLARDRLEVQSRVRLFGYYLDPTEATTEILTAIPPPTI